MLIINADDFGRSRAETDAAVSCFDHGRISSITAMVFMEDSERAAELAREKNIDAGLHLNFDELFTDENAGGELRRCHEATRHYLTRYRLSQLLYNPLLTRVFEYSYHKQLEEFQRLFRAPPSHVDGHHHMHLCANLVFRRVISRGTKIRPTFSFWPGEKSGLNRAYRKLLDVWLRRTYCLPDYFFDLSDCVRHAKWQRVAALSKEGAVELMTHPVNPTERDDLMSSDFDLFLRNVELGSYSDLPLHGLGCIGSKRKRLVQLLVR